MKISAEPLADRSFQLYCPKQRVHSDVMRGFEARDLSGECTLPGKSKFPIKYYVQWFENYPDLLIQYVLRCLRRSVARRQSPFSRLLAYILYMQLDQSLKLTRISTDDAVAGASTLANAKLSR